MSELQRAEGGERSAERKAALRRWARAARAELPDASALICEHLEGFLRARQARVVLAYRAFRFEPDLSALLERLPGVQWLTTRVADRQHLTLHPFLSATVPNRMGILEPPADAARFAPELVDIALVPGLVFARDGARLGYGAGFYDRLLPQLRPDAVTVGITRDALVVNTLPLEPWDALMTHLCTESGLWVCNSVANKAVAEGL